MRINEQMKEVFTSLGLNIKNLREKQKVSLQELSLKTGIRKEYLEKIEKGTAYGVLVEKHLFVIANTLNVKLSELLNYE